MQTISLAEVKAAALKAYNERRLLAQNTWAVGSAYGYEVKCGDTSYVCAIGAALNREVLDKIDVAGFQTKSLRAMMANLPSHIACFGAESKVLYEIQNAHDVWSTMAEEKTSLVAMEYESKFLAMLQP